MSVKSKRLSYNLYIKINEDLVILIEKIVYNNMKQLIKEFENINNDNIKSYINMLKMWEQEIKNLLEINDISKAKKYIVNNYSKLKLCEKEMIKIKIDINLHNLRISELNKELSVLLVDEKDFNNWTTYIKIIENQINSSFLDASLKICNLNIKLEDKFYYYNKIYYELFINIKNNKITIDEIKYLINKLVECSKEIKELIYLIAIDKGTEVVNYINKTIFELIIKEFKKLTYREQHWTNTWNKTIQKYAIINDIVAIYNQFIFEIIEKNCLLNISNEINKNIFNEIINIFKEVVDNLKNIAQESKNKARNSFSDVITNLKEDDIKEAEHKKLIEKEKYEEEMNKQKIIKEKEEKLIEIEKIKKEEEIKEKEMKKMIAEQKAILKAAEKLEKQKIFLNKKK